DGLMHLSLLQGTKGDPTITGFAIYSVASGLPTITLSTPNTTFTAPASIVLNASASAVTGRQVTSVEFYSGTTLLGKSSAAPYTFTWNGVAAGTYSLSAKVIDSAGSSAISNLISVTVTPLVTPPPTITLSTASSTYTAPATI